jgi:hypothetical protein
VVFQLTRRTGKGTLLSSTAEPVQGSANRSSAMAKKPQKVVAPVLLFRAPAMSASKVEQLIEQINAGRYGAPELINLYDNAQERNQTSVMEAVIARMRGNHAAAATRKFGRAEKPARKPRVAAESAAQATAAQAEPATVPET